jgi:hypothetical protein
VSGKLARKPRGKLTPEKRLVYEEAIARRARQLVVRVILPGEWYLVRWGGTRKGSGTFYTRPGLAVPTVQRTLRPLAYAAPQRDDGQPDRDAPPAAWTPRPPEEILALKVCDPACGSGTFPVAALRFLTDALYASLHEHGRVREDGERAIVRLLEQPSGDAGEEPLARELLPCRPDDPLFEPRLKAILRRHVVERCVYGVDLDPLAVELCRLSLWIETMDRTLPFSFLDHKVKCGNALVGAWFDQFQHYPVMAWKNREGGDKNHGNGVHFEKGARTRAIKAFVKERLTPDLREFLCGRTLFSEDLAQEAAAVHDDALATLARLHDLPVQDTAERARIYRDELLGSEAYRSLKAAMDLWCACWFWPADELEDAPLPTTLAEPPGRTRAIAEQVAARKRFFHWELEFPDVFREAGAGFDAVLGNPPWETLQPNSKEFFSNIDPLFRSYGKQEALRYQTANFAERPIELSWLEYGAGFADDSNWMRYAAQPSGDPSIATDGPGKFTIGRGKESAALHTRWRRSRSQARGFAEPSHPFRHRGEGKAYTYKLFLEQGHALLRDRGRLGLIVPSGLYSDHGTGRLRQLFLDRCSWEWLFGFENREKIFDIDSRFKFNPVVVEKGGETEAIRTAFMRRKLEDWEVGEALCTPYTCQQVVRFSPRSRSILEIQSRRDLEILEKIYANCVMLGDDGPDGWGIRYRQGDVNMTSDSKLFPLRRKWEADGYRPDEYSRWQIGDWRPISELWAELGVKPLPTGERRNAQPPYDLLPLPRADIPAGVILARNHESYIRDSEVAGTALPLYLGKMIYTNQWAANVTSSSGLGRRLDLEPDFLLGSDNLRHNPAEGARVGFRDIARTTDMRTFIATLMPPFPCGNKIPLLQTGSSVASRLQLVTFLSSLVFDWCTRVRLSATSLNWHIVESLALPRPSAAAIHWLRHAARLLMTGPQFAQDWLALRGDAGNPHLGPTTAHERLRLSVILDCLAAAGFGLTLEDLAHVLRDCDRPCGETADLAAKGFWRIDKNVPPELRHTVLTLVAFQDLAARVQTCGDELERGIASFLGQNDGEGWMIPETLRLDEHGLGHDGRAKEHQPVAARLDGRFHPWEQESDDGSFWRECEVHAANLQGLSELTRTTDGSVGAEEPRPLGEREAHRPKTRDRGAGQTWLFEAAEGDGREEV